MRRVCDGLCVAAETGLLVLCGLVAVVESICLVARGAGFSGAGRSTVVLVEVIGLLVRVSGVLNGQHGLCVVGGVLLFDVNVLRGRGNAALTRVCAHVRIVRAFLCGGVGKAAIFVRALVIAGWPRVGVRERLALLGCAGRSPRYRSRRDWEGAEAPVSP